MEAISQLYRSLSPVQPWLYYLLEAYQGPEKIVGVFLSAAYMVAKSADLISRSKLLRTSIFKLLQNVVRHILLFLNYYNCSVDKLSSLFSQWIRYILESVKFLKGKTILYGLYSRSTKKSCYNPDEAFALSMYTFMKTI